MGGRYDHVARPTRKKRFDLSALDSVEEDIRLPSLSAKPPRVEGFAHRFKIILPLLSQSGEEVFTEYHLRLLFELFDRRFGGCLASSSVVHPPWVGSYLPEQDAEPEKDYHTIIYAYTKPVDVADRFFRVLKTILKTAGFKEQDEVLIERVPVWLVEGAG